MNKPCEHFEEDWAVCYDCGEPKGQCINCGYMDYEHHSIESVAKRSTKPLDELARDFYLKGRDIHES